ncbi:FAD-dependent monooxygenase [Actinokineospora iranica]|uniref:2-polyprenyl-6-methoxyphenol hydroxylase n=1 Tax=Actinokineospora iranica TaxID=1271860 RepID=A0A1G6X0V1_9PSEU|nr:FAD-dependent monooxygenase [Actinokineospora iranica]SDD71850.1 2-polyprenyl-6-methoxyphenol hydroxylase [Actinokineospora iranica]
MRTAAVIGGGIGGLAVAAGLARRGWAVRVHEQAAAFGEVGAGISIWGNALRALDVLGVGDAVRDAGARPGRGGFRNRRGHWILRGSGEPGDLVMVHRADLLRILLGAVPAEALRPGERRQDFRVEGGRAVIGEETVDLLIGADGMHSAVRRAFWPDAPGPVYTGHTAWRMVLPAAGIEPFDGSETWGAGDIFGAFPMGADQIYCYAAAVLPANTRLNSERAELRRRFAGWPEPIPSLLAAVAEDAVLRHDLYYLPPLPSYVHGPVALVGDAAHAMSPNLGQGACQALEDAVTLAALAGTEDGLRRYDELRRPRSQWVSARSRMAGKLNHVANRPAAALRDTALRLLPDALLRRSTAPLLDWRPPT